MAAINYFLAVPGVAPMIVLDIAPSNGPQTPDQAVSLGDIMGAIAGFQGEAYLGNGPLGCP